MIMVDICDSREIHSRNIILNNGKISEIRHETIDNRSQGISERIIGGPGIKFHDLFISRTCLKKQSRPPRAPGLDIDYESDIVKYIIVLFPYRFHAKHSNFLS